MNNLERPLRILRNIKYDNFKPGLISYFMNHLFLWPHYLWPVVENIAGEGKYTMQNPTSRPQSESWRA